MTKNAAAEIIQKYALDPAVQLKDREVAKRWLEKNVVPHVKLHPTEVELIKTALDTLIEVRREEVAGAEPFDTKLTQKRDDISAARVVTSKIRSAMGELP